MTHNLIWLLTWTSWRRPLQRLKPASMISGSRWGRTNSSSMRTRWAHHHHSYNVTINTIRIGDCEAAASQTAKNLCATFNTTMSFSKFKSHHSYNKVFQFPTKINCSSQEISSQKCCQESTIYFHFFQAGQWNSIGIWFAKSSVFKEYKIQQLE